MNKVMIGTVGLLFLAASPVFANPSTDSAAQAEAKTYNSIPYASGGFGADERANLRAMNRTDNLELSFALKNKDYLSGADVIIRDDQGKEILKAPSDGPLFFTKLPEGKYTVTATTLGRTLTRDVEVPNKGQARLYFTWKEPSASAAATLAKK